MNRHPIEKLWREVGLPEYFLGNDGSNTKLYALYDAIRLSPLSAGDTGEDHARGCEGRSYTCTCGYDDARDAEIDRLRRELEEHQAAKWKEKHVDTMNDMAALRIALEGVEAQLSDARRELEEARRALEPFALMSSEGVVKAETGYVSIKTCAEYFHAARAALRSEEEGR